MNFEQIVFFLDNYSIWEASPAKLFEAKFVLENLTRKSKMEKKNILLQIWEKTKIAGL